MKYSEFRRWLLQQGATISPGKGSHFKVSLHGKSTVFPYHGAKEIGTGLVEKSNETSGLNLERCIIFFAGAIMLSYPVTLTQDSNGSLLVGFPDVPNANSVGSNQEEALANAADALETALEICVDERRSIPMPSPVKDGEASVTLPALSTAKVLLWNEMLSQHIRKVELARRLGWQVPQVDSLFDLTQPSGIDLLERAAQAMGRRIELRLG